MSGIKDGYAKVVNPDGSAIDGLEEFKLDVTDGAISQNINISDIPSGAYALSVRMTDKNGLEATAKSDTFYIRIHADNRRKLLPDLRIEISLYFSRRINN